MFSQFLSAFPKSAENIRYFEEKVEPKRLFVSETIDSKNSSYLNDLKSSCQNTYGQSTF